METPRTAPDLLGQILHAAQVGESTDWEFKSARGGFPGSFWETYSAMANAEGGVVVLGVRETDTGAVLDGLMPEQIARHLAAMTKQGLLRLRHPESPNQPDQAYTTAKGTS
jgi:predicted HTH transcriptional regulator